MTDFAAPWSQPPIASLEEALIALSVEILRKNRPRPTDRADCGAPGVIAPRESL
jgi:hypothetical protein